MKTVICTIMSSAFLFGCNSASNFIDISQLPSAKTANGMAQSNIPNRDSTNLDKRLPSEQQTKKKISAKEAAALVKKKYPTGRMVDLKLKKSTYTIRLMCSSGRPFYVDVNRDSGLIVRTNGSACN